MSTVLRNIITAAKDEHRMPLKDLTVLATQRDPYRLDTPANHDLGQWLADAYNEVNPERRRLHLRGLHYALVGRVALPNGKPYSNNDETWLFLSEKAAKAARYLGYLPWSALRDARNAPPQIFTPDFYRPNWHLLTGTVQVDIPASIEPHFYLHGDLGRQPCRQVVIAEKQGVEDVLLPVCRRRQATLALPAGEISDTMVYEILSAAAEDGRPLVIHQVGDFDPAGWQMAVSTARTVQALRDSQFPDLEVRLHAVGLTGDQCEEWKLPATPLKETERRADRWKAAMGREQTELDAAVALAPEAFAETVEDSLLQYYDTGLDHRAEALRWKLADEANERLVKQLGPETLEAIRTSAEAKLEQLADLVREVNDALFVLPEDVGIETPDAPEILIGDTACREAPLYDSSDDWATSTRRLIARKRY